MLIKGLYIFETIYPKTCLGYIFFDNSFSRCLLKDFSKGFASFAFRQASLMPRSLRRRESPGGPRQVRAPSWIEEDILW